MANKRKFFAVRRGRVPGIYDDWDTCHAQVEKFKGNEYKSFPTRAEAERYMNPEAGASISVGTTNAFVPPTRATHAFVSPPPARPAKLRHLDKSHKSFASIEETPKMSYDSNPFKNHAFAVPSSVLEKLGTELYQVLPDAPEAIEMRNLGQTSLLSSEQPGQEQTFPIDHNAVYQLEYDGASKGNPGVAGAGALLRHPDGTVVCELSIGLGKATNNVAEYRALLAGMKKALDLGIQKVRVQGDSKLVTEQVKGVWAVKNANLAVLCTEARQLVKNFKNFTIRHVDREWNSDADALANKGVGLPEEKFVSAFKLKG